MARRRVRALSALAAAPLLVVLAGCGSDDTNTQAAPASQGVEASTPSTTTSTPSTPATSTAPPTTAVAPTTSGSTSAAPGNGKVTALFFGDSYIVGGAYTGPDDSMGALAADELGWTWTIRGGGGTGFVAGNPDYDLLNYMGQIKQGALDVGPVNWLVIEGGGNDKTDDPATITADAVATLQEAQKLHPEARVVLVGTMDPTIDSFTDTDGVIGALGAAAQQVGVPYIDAQHWLEGHPEDIGPDFDHPTPAGHVLCGHKLAAALRALGA